MLPLAADFWCSERKILLINFEKQSLSKTCDNRHNHINIFIEFETLHGDELLLMLLMQILI